MPIKRPSLLPEPTDTGILGKLREEIPTGLWPDAFDLRIPLWKTGSNIQFSELGVEKIPGHSTFFALLGTNGITRGAHQFRDTAGVQLLYFGDAARLFKWNTVSVSTELSGLSGIVNETVNQSATQWSIVNFGNIVLATNGVDEPQIDTGGGMGALGADFTTAEIFINRGPHILGFNTSINARGFVWADEDNPSDWTPATDNAAGDLIIRELQSDIIAAAMLGDRIAVYGKEQMYVVEFIGAPLYFGYKPALEGFGAISKKSVISVGRKNYGMGRDGFWVTDGADFDFIDDPAVRQFFQGDMNFAQKSKVNGWHDEKNHQVIWYYPSVGGAGEVDSSVAFDYKKGLWSIRADGRTASLERQVFDNPIVFDAAPSVFLQNFGDNADGSALVASVRSKPMDLGTPDRVKEVDAIRIGYQGTGLRARVGTQFSLDDAITFGSFFEVPAGYVFQPVRIAGRYLTIELQSQDIGDAWDVSSIDFYGRLEGER